MDVSYPIRPVDDAGLPVFGQVSDQAFNSNVPPATMLEFDRLVIEPERTLVAFDGDLPVGTTLAFSFGLTVTASCARSLTRQAVPHQLRLGGRRSG